MSEEERWYDNFIKNNKTRKIKQSKTIRLFNEELENEWFNENEEQLRLERKKEVVKTLLDFSKKTIYSNNLY